MVEYKWKINITLNNADTVMTNYFYHHNDEIYSWCNDGFCKPVDQNWVLILHGNHYQFIEAIEIDIPTIDPGELIFCEDTCNKSFNVRKVAATEVRNDAKDDSNEDSEDSPFEKIPEKKSKKASSK